MRHSTYKALPLGALCELLTDAIIELFEAHDSKEDCSGEFRAQKKYIEGLLLVIREKKQLVVISKI